MDVPNNDYGEFLTGLEQKDIAQKGNDINRQCAEILGWRVYNRKDDPEYFFHTPLGEIQVRINDFVQPCPDFCNDWNAIKMLVEYARGRMPYVDILMSVHQVACSLGPTTGVAETAPLAVALAFLKCFGKGKNDES